MKRLPSLPFVLLVLAVLVLTGCQRRSMTEEKKRSPVPRNAQEAANTWSGTRLMLTGPSGELLFKLRKRQGGSYKVFTAEQTTLGYVRRQGDAWVLTHNDAKTGYLIAPQPSADKRTIFTVRPTLQDDDSKGPLPKADTTKLLARIERLDPKDSKKDCPVWRFKDGENKLIAELQHHKKPNPDGDIVKLNCNDINAVWSVGLPTSRKPSEADPSPKKTWWLNAAKTTGRTVQATATLELKPPKSDTKSKPETAFTLSARRFPTIATAPMLFSGDDPLLTSGYMALLEGSLRSDIPTK